MTPLQDDEISALMKEAEPCGHLPCFGIRRDVLARLLAELVIRREADEPARKFSPKDDGDLAGMHFARLARMAAEDERAAGRGML